MINIVGELRFSWFRRLVLLGLATAGAFIQISAWAVQEHVAEKLQLNNQLTLSSLLDTTLERHPQSGVLAARAASGDAEARYAKRWLPDTTTLAAFHMSDRAFDDIGAFENEVALSFPLWLPGERKAQSALGDVMSESRVSDEAQLRWQVSGKLRLQLWGLKLAVRQWELAVDQEQRLAEVLTHVTLFTEAGEYSRADQLATMEELAVWKGETMLLEAQYMDAIRLYHSFTGMDSIPARIDETLSELEGIGLKHPALRQAMDHLAEASAATEVIREQSNVRPSLDVFWRDFASDDLSPDVNALGIGFAIPIGRSPKREPAVARSFEELAVAQAELSETMRMLELDFHEASHVLHTTQERLENSSDMMKAASERHELDKLAFELGEFSTQEWLRRLSRFKEIERTHELLLIQQGAAIAAYNQAVGDTL